MGQYRTTRGEALPATRREKKSFLWRTLAILLLLIGGTAVGGHYLQLNRYAPANGYVTTEIYAEVRSPVAAQVVDIKHFSGDAVTAGEVLLRLDDEEQRAAVAEAEAAVRKAEAELTFREAELADRRREHTSLVESAKLALDYARQRIELTSKLAEQGLASGRDLADDTYTLKQAEAEYERLSKADTTLDERQIEVLQREHDARKETVVRMRAAQDLRSVRAPINGKLLRHTFYVGEVVRPDLLLYEVFGGNELILKLRVPERYAAKVMVGQPVRAELRSHKTLMRNWVYGVVAEARSVIQVDGSQSYRVIYCSFDPKGREIQPGTTADAEIKVGRTSFWEALLGM
ncbi:MAG: HlyD family efflux transporter periplasmic adaptor subunit [Lentisphaerae bacterium]|nr:HlyD family efflux transporter periplasmic adaptor subunit [Lentisphaerota bacterium]